VDTQASERFVHALLQRWAAGCQKVVRFFAAGCLRFLVLGWPILFFFSVMVDADEREEIFRFDFDGPGRWGGEGRGSG
jgi:hypothetical protein